MAGGRSLGETMRQLLTLVVFGLCCAAVAPRACAEEFRPISAKEAERVVAEERDFLTDILWMGIDGYWHEGDGESCVRLCQEITVLDPQFVEAYTNAAYLRWNENRDAEAIALYEQGLAANPESPELYFDCGFFYRDRKNYPKAIEMLRLAVKYGAEQTQQHLLPNTLEESGDKAGALAEWRKLLQRFPGDRIAQRKIARLEKELAKPVS